MTPPKSRSHTPTLDVLSTKVDELDRRVGELEEADKEREDSNAGIRKEFADHRVEDAQVAGELKGLIAEVDKRLEAFGARLGAMKWMLITVIALGLFNITGAIIILIRASK